MDNQAKPLPSIVQPFTFQWAPTTFLLSLQQSKVYCDLSQQLEHELNSNKQIKQTINEENYPLVSYAMYCRYRFGN